jgi:two-component system chemotaxis response regulator CheB
MSRRRHKTIRVLIVDDSAFMRRSLTDMIESDPQLEVVAYAKDGLEALTAIADLRPDVVTMDLELPRIDGLTCVAYIAEHFPTPVLVVTGFSKFRGEDTVRALEYGAVAVIRKPARLTDGKADQLSLELTTQIRIAAAVDPAKLRPLAVRRINDGGPQTEKIVAIASSTGGPRALSQIIPNLPKDFEAAVVVAQHMPALFVPPLAERLNKESLLRVKVSEDGEPVRRGKVLFVPGDSHCTVQPSSREGPVIRISHLPPGKGGRLTSADGLMASLAPIYGVNATGVVLTGMGLDGTEGLRAIRHHGGRTIAEAEATAIVFGMPKSAIASGVVHEIVPLPQITHAILRSVRGEA